MLTTIDILERLDGLLRFAGAAPSRAPSTHPDTPSGHFVRGRIDGLSIALSFVSNELAGAVRREEEGRRLRELDAASRRHVRLMPDRFMGITPPPEHIRPLDAVDAAVQHCESMMIDPNTLKRTRVPSDARLFANLRRTIDARETLAAYETLEAARRERQRQRQPVKVHEVPLGYTGEVTALAFYIKGVKPTIPGVYRRLFETRKSDSRVPEFREWFCFWSGFEWGAGQATADEAYVGRNLKGDAGPLCWRGRPGDGKPFPMSEEFVLDWLAR